MMFAMVFEPNATQHNHFVVAFDFLESLLKDFDRILSVADEKLFERACHASRCLGQPSRSGSSPVHRIIVRNPAPTGSLGPPRMGTMI